MFGYILVLSVHCHCLSSTFGHSSRRYFYDKNHITTYDQCWSSVYMKRCYTLWYQRPMVSSYQQFRRGSDKMNIYVDLSSFMLDILLCRE